MIDAAATSPDVIDVDRAAAVTITWQDGHVSRYELPELRRSCPCAGMQGGADGGYRAPRGRRPVDRGREVGRRVGDDPDVERRSPHRHLFVGQPQAYLPLLGVRDPADRPRRPGAGPGAGATGPGA